MRDRKRQKRSLQSACNVLAAAGGGLDPAKAKQIRVQICTRAGIPSGPCAATWLVTRPRVSMV